MPSDPIPAAMLQAAATDLKKETTRLERLADLADVLGKVGNLEAAAFNARERLDKLTADEGVANTRIRHLQARNDELTGKLKELASIDTQITQRQKALDDLNKRIAAVKKPIQTRDEIEQQIVAAEERLAKVNAEIEQLRAKFGA